MRLHTIETGFFKLDGGAMFGVVPKSIWQKTNPPDDKNLCTWAMRCLLLEDGDKHNAASEFELALIRDPNEEDARKGLAQARGSKRPRK